MLTITINGTQISEYLKSYECEIEEVYDEDNAIEAIDGTQHRTYMGDRRTLKVYFEPMNTQQITQLFTAIKSERLISIGYIDPQLGSTSRTFNCPSLPATTYFEGDDHVQYWEVPPITFIEPELDKSSSGGGGGGGGGGGDEDSEWKYSLVTPFGTFAQADIDKNLKMSQSLGSEGFNVGQLASCSLSGSVYVGNSGGLPPKGNVLLYAGQDSPSTLFFSGYLKDTYYAEDGSYVNFTAVDLMSFLDNDYFVEYETDEQTGELIPQTVYQHKEAVEEMISGLAGVEVVFPALCDNVLINPESGKNSRQLISEIASSSGVCYRTAIADPPHIESFTIGADIYNLDDIREPAAYGYVDDDTISTVVIYCGAVNKIPHAIGVEGEDLEAFNSKYNIYFAGEIPASGYLNSKTTLEVNAPFYGISAKGDSERQGGLFNGLVDHQFGTSFSCPKVKVISPIPIGARIIGADYSANVESYASNIGYSFTASGVFADITCDARGAVESNYLGQMQRQMEKRIKIDSTYNNVLIDDSGIKLAAPHDTYQNENE